LRSANPSDLALKAAIRIAQAFHSEIESLFIEDEQLLDCAGYGFVREVSLTGRQRRPISAADMMRALQLAAQGARRQIEGLAKLAEVPLHSRIVRDEPLRALSIACARTGPWNLVALADPLSVTNSGILKQLLQEISGTTGLMVVGPKGERVTGPAIAAVEDTGRLPAMLRTAERLAALDRAEVVLVLVAEDEERLRQMDSEARLAVAAREGVRIESAEITRGEASVVAESLRRLRGGFVICQFGGLLVPAEGDPRALLSVLECPLLLVR
jgi:hypothetical protein